MHYILLKIISKNPINAVRQVLNEVLSQHQRRTNITNGTSKVHRGSKPTSTVGLNITDDDYVLLKLKEKK